MFCHLRVDITTLVQRKLGKQIMIINGSTLGSMGEMKDPNVSLIMPIYPFPWAKLKSILMTLAIKEPYLFKHETS